jgi:hypothetical protein
MKNLRGDLTLWPIAVDRDDNPHISEEGQHRRRSLAIGAQPFAHNVGDIVVAACKDLIAPVTAQRRCIAARICAPIADRAIRQTLLGDIVADDQLDHQVERTGPERPFQSLRLFERPGIAIEDESNLECPGQLVLEKVENQPIWNERSGVDISLRLSASRASATNFVAQEIPGGQVPRPKPLSQSAALRRFACARRTNKEQSSYAHAERVVVIGSRRV